MLLLSVMLPASILVAETVASYCGHSENICTLLVNPHIVLVRGFCSCLRLCGPSGLLPFSVVDCCKSLWNVCCHFSEVDSYSFGPVVLLPCSNYLGILLLPIAHLPCPIELRNGKPDFRVSRHAVIHGLCGHCLDVLC